MSRYHRNTDDTDEPTTTTAELDDDVHAALRDADEPLADAINHAVRRSLGIGPSESESPGDR
jgi:hypothetical protein